MVDSDFLWPSPRYSAFTQAVRRYRPSQLLPILAGMTVREDPNYRRFEEVRALPPWSTMAIARESIVRGNEFRNGSATPDDVRKLIQLHHEVFVEPSRESITAVLGPLMLEQMYWQISQYEEQTRAISLFDDPAFGPQWDWAEVLRMPLVTAVKAVFLIGLAVNKNGGRWDPSTVDHVYQADPRLERHISLSKVRVMADSLTASLERIRDEGRAYDERRDIDRDLAKHPLNPLFAHPLVDLGEAGVWAPVAPVIWRTLLPNVLYVRGREQWGNAFSTLLGQRFEQYVGELIRNAAPELLAEIAYGKGGGQKSVDWIWIGPEAIVLVECKSAGLSIDSIAGGGRFPEIVQRSIVHARRQIDRTAAAMKSNASGFETLPTDRPVYGLVVTSDPFFMANAGVEEYGSSGTTPTLVATVRAIEQLTSQPDALDQLVAVFNDPERRRWDLEQAIRDLPAIRHPVSERAWERISPAKQPPDGGG